MHQAQWSPERPLPPPVSLAVRSPLRSPAQVEGTQGFLPQPGKALERPSSTRLEARFPYHGSGESGPEGFTVELHQNFKKYQTNSLQFFARNNRPILCNLVQHQKTDVTFCNSSYEARIILIPNQKKDMTRKKKILQTNMSHSYRYIGCQQNINTYNITM